MEGGKKHYSGSDVNEHAKEKEGAGDLVGRGMASLDGVDWMGFAGTKVEELGVGQVYPDQGVEGVESVASMEEGTCTPGLVAYTEDTGR